MPDVLLPTVGLNAGSKSASALDTTMRLKAVNPDESILAHANPNRALKHGQEALEVIDKYQKLITYKKKKALYDQAVGLYREDVSNLKTQYTNKQGENAVKGLEEYNNNLQSLQKKYAKTFNDSDIQDAFNLQINQDNVEAKIDGRNWHDKQVQVMAKAEKQARLDLAMDHWLSNLGSPFEKKNYEEVNATLKDKLLDDGHPEGSEAYLAQSIQYYDTATAKAMRGLIAHDVRQAQRALPLLRGKISDNQYNIYEGAINDKIRDEAIHQARLADIQENRMFRAQMAKDRETEKRARELSQHMTSERILLTEEGFRAEMAKDKKWGSLVGTPEFELEVASRTEQARQTWNQSADRYNAQKGMLEHIVNLTLAKKTPTEIQALIDAPLTVFSNEKDRAEFLKNYKNVDEANQDLRAMMLKNTSDTSLANTQKLNSMSEVVLASVVDSPNDLIDKFGVPVSEVPALEEKWTKGKSMLGDDKTYRTDIDETTKQYFNLSSKDLKDDKNVYLRAFVGATYQKFLKQISNEAYNSKDNSQIYLLKDPRYVRNAWKNYCSSDYDFQRNINEIKTLQDNVREFYEDHQESIQVNFPNEVSAITKIMSLAYNHFVETGDIPSGNQLEDITKQYDLKVKANLKIMSQYDTNKATNSFDMRGDYTTSHYKNFNPVAR